MKLPFFISRSSNKEVLTSIRFVVLINIHTIGFQSVGGIGRSYDVDYITEGGKNDYPYVMKLPQTTPHKLTFKRGVVMKKFNILSLLKGSIGSLDSTTAITSRGSIGTIIVLGEKQEIKAIYGFISEGEAEWTVSDLDAEKASPLIETFTITHRGLHNIPIPSL